MDRSVEPSEFWGIASRSVDGVNSKGEPVLPWQTDDGGGLEVDIRDAFRGFLM